MNINCIICSDLFVPGCTVYVTQCDHIFHNTCLTQWIERSKTCPQCQSPTTEDNIFKVYIDTSQEIFLKEKLIAVKLQLRLPENQVNNNIEEVIHTVYDEKAVAEQKNKQFREELAKHKLQFFLYYKEKIDKLREKIQEQEEAMKTLTEMMERSSEMTTIIKQKLQLLEELKKKMPDVKIINSQQIVDPTLVQVANENSALLPKTENLQSTSFSVDSFAVADRMEEGELSSEVKRIKLDFEM